VIPTTPASTQTRFCHLRTDYFDDLALAVADRVDHRRPAASWSAAARACCWSERSGMVWAIRRRRSNLRQVLCV
jgi:hypothetical protein